MAKRLRFFISIVIISLLLLSTVPGSAQQAPFPFLSRPFQLQVHQATRSRMTSWSMEIQGLTHPSTLPWIWVQSDTARHWTSEGIRAPTQDHFPVFWQPHRIPPLQLLVMLLSTAEAGSPSPSRHLPSKLKEEDNLSKTSSAPWQNWTTLQSGKFHASKAEYESGLNSIHPHIIPDNFLCCDYRRSSVISTTDCPGC